MRFDQIAGILEGIPHTSREAGKVLYGFVLQHASVRDVLELGFGHGVSACYIAAALQERGGGSVLTLDLTAARDRQPSITDLIERTGLGDFVKPVFCETSYTWELLRMIERATRRDRCDPIFDFCFVDGAHNWDTDGFAFFLVDKLLRPGGWILLDDLDWSYDASPTLRETEWVQALPPEQRSTPQIGKVFDLLVRQHEDYTDARADGSWGWARKRARETGFGRIARAARRALSK